MKKYVLLFLCLIITPSLLALNTQEGLTPWPIIEKSTPAWKILENLNPSEKGNAIIELELDDKASEISNQEARLIEAKWNEGNYNEAVALLKECPDLYYASIGIQWKKPEFRSVKWENDVQIGTRDSIIDIAFDVDTVTGHLFTALLYRTGSVYKFCINMSTDTGMTWAETYNWTANPTYEIDIDAVVYGDYLYLAYTYTNNTEGRMRRFYTSDGTSDGVYGNVTVIDEGTALREIALASTNDYTPANVFYFAIMEDDSLRYYYSNSVVSSWYSLKPEIGNADRGLDACFDPPGTGSFVWASYVGTDDSLYAVARGPWEYYNLYYFGTNSNAKTSIAAYKDTVIVFYPYTISGVFNYLRYRISYNNGTDWYTGFFGNADTISLADVTGRHGDGFGVAYSDWTSGIGWRGMFRHRDYNDAWTSPVEFADNVPRITVKPEIERVISGVYGIVYAMYPGQTVYFDRSDWPSGIDNTEELDKINVLNVPNRLIVNGNLKCIYTLKNPGNIKLSIYNITGQEVKILDRGIKPAGKHSCELNINNLSSGTYFIYLIDFDGGIYREKVLLLK